MKIKDCLSGREIDTDKTLDVDAMVLEKLQEFQLFLSQYNIPHIIITVATDKCPTSIHCPDKKSIDTIFSTIDILVRKLSNNQCYVALVPKNNEN